MTIKKKCGNCKHCHWDEMWGEGMQYEIFWHYCELKIDTDDELVEYDDPACELWER